MADGMPLPVAEGRPDQLMNDLRNTAIKSLPLRFAAPRALDGATGSAHDVWCEAGDMLDREALIRGNLRSIRFASGYATGRGCTYLFE
ncbi:MAG: hypothetical protein ACYCZE_09840 [Thiobacillus sp.]